jgi:3-phenylpropionate/cinnamic acid dioxygenase small subunit
MSSIPTAAPDFTQLAQDVAAPPRTLPQTGVPAPALRDAPLQVQREVEQFLYRQAELLDGKHWQAWIDCFHEAGVYWMPVTPEQTEWESSPSIFAEDKLMMEIRKGRVSHPNAWSQAPMWETNHVVSHVALEAVSGSEIRVRSRFHMMELRRDQVRHFGGRYLHTLVRGAEGALRIKLQRVDLFNGQAPFDYVLQIWV